MKDTGFGWRVLQALVNYTSLNQLAPNVKGAVSSDYQDLLEQQWVDSLRKKYKVEVNKKVLNQLKKQYK